MKSIWPLLAAGLLLCPAAARAQGYSGVMAPQEGYHAPPATGGGGTSPGGNFGSPYSGTGASDTTGYANMMDSNNTAATQDYAQQDPAMPDDDAPARHVKGSAFVESFKPKPTDGDDRGGVSIYDQVQDNSGTATDRRRRAILRKIDAEQKKAQEQMKRASEEHDREVQAYIKKTVRDSMPKKDGDDGTDDDQQAGDQADDNSSPDAVKE